MNGQLIWLLVSMMDTSTLEFDFVNIHEYSPKEIEIIDLLKNMLK